MFYLLRKHKLLVSGDIGCYGIGVLPPFTAMDALISMGASIGMAHGMERAGVGDRDLGERLRLRLSPHAVTVLPEAGPNG